MIEGLLITIIVLLLIIATELICVCVRKTYDEYKFDPIKFADDVATALVKKIGK